MLLEVIALLRRGVSYDDLHQKMIAAIGAWAGEQYIEGKTDLIKK